MKKGFTLIELLVVVLIIGILSAVALPQYNAAVERARLATVMADVKHGKEMLEMYYLANGSYPATLGDADFEISGCTLTDDKLLISCKNSYYHFVTSGIAGVVRLSGQKYTAVYYQGLDYRDGGKKQCWAQQNNEPAHRACKAMGGGSSSAADSNGWVKYQL